MDWKVWLRPMTSLRWPLLINLRAEPVRACLSQVHRLRSLGDQAHVCNQPAPTVLATDFLKTFLDFPPRQKPGNFSAEATMQKLEAAHAGNK
jgi:arylsulfatase